MKSTSFLTWYRDDFTEAKYSVTKGEFEGKYQMSFACTFFVICSAKYTHGEKARRNEGEDPQTPEHETVKYFERPSWYFVSASLLPSGSRKKEK